MTKKVLKELTYNVIGAAIEVHRALGPGLLETVYRQCMCHEMLGRGIGFISEVKIPVYYKGIEMITGLRCDFFVEDILVVELKAVQEILPIYEAQIISYMKLLNAPKGILINFHSVNIFKEGQKTYVNEVFSALEGD